MPQMTIRCMRYACRITEAIDTCSKFAILIGCTRQQWSREHASTLHVQRMLRISHVHNMILFL